MHRPICHNHCLKYCVVLTIYNDAQIWRMSGFDWKCDGIVLDMFMGNIYCCCHGEIWFRSDNHSVETPINCVLIRDISFRRLIVIWFHDILWISTESHVWWLHWETLHKRSLSWQRGIWEVLRNHGSWNETSFRFWNCTKGEPGLLSMWLKFVLYTNVFFCEISCENRD